MNENLLNQNLVFGMSQDHNSNANTEVVIQVSSALYYAIQIND